LYINNLMYMQYAGINGIIFNERYIYLILLQLLDYSVDNIFTAFKYEYSTFSHIFFILFTLKK
jgi:hypothetical protein